MAQLRDIYRYFGGGLASYGDDTPFDNSGIGNDWNDPNSSFVRQTGEQLGLGGENERNQVHWSIKPGSFLDTVNQQYGGAANIANMNPGSAADWRLNVDYSKLPSTRFGSVDNTVSVDDNIKVVDPRYVYEDPNYGRITFKGNTRTGNEWLGPALMMAVGAGMGSLVGAAGGGSAFKTASSVLRGLQSATRGNPLSALASITGLTGAPQWASVLARLAASRFGGGRRG